MKIKLLVTSISIALLAGCGGPQIEGGKYFEDDGPPSTWKAMTMESDDAIPRIDKPIAAANKPYTVRGKRYYPQTGDKPLVQTGYGSWYGSKFHGKKTSTGEVYDMYAMTAAHTTMELPSYARVTNLENGRSIIVRVNDRGPFLNNRVIDLSYAAATKLGYATKGTAKVKVERITRSQIASGRWDKSTTTTTKLAKVAPLITKAVSGQPVLADKKDVINEVATMAVNELKKMGADEEPVVKADVVVVEKTPTSAEKPAERKLIEEGVFVMADGSTAVGKTETSFKDEPQLVSENVKVTNDAAPTVAAPIENLNAKPVKPEAAPKPAAAKPAPAAKAPEAPKPTQTAAAQPKPAPAKPAPAKPAAVPATYAVQIGVFRNHDNAIALKQKAEAALSQKLTTSVRVVEVRGGLYKVLIGGGESHEEASGVARIVRDVMKQTAIVARDVHD